MTTMQASAARIEWVDYAKGICIILVVMMHVVNGYEGLVGEEGWLRPVVDFAKPFRMPDFFLISGLFLARTLHGSVLSYFDRKLLHFVYFYLLWLTIQLPLLEHDLLLADPAGFARAWLHALYEPTNTLWFVHMLAVFYVVTWLLKDVPKWLVLPAVIALQTAYQAGLIDTGWNVADRFANRYVYFYLGYAAAPYVFQMARVLAARLWLVALLLPAWALGNGLMVGAGLHNGPGTSLLLGFAGAAAVCAISATLAERGLATGLRYAGQHSIVIYLSFFLPMKVMQKVFGTLGSPFDSVGLATTLILLLAVVGPLIFHRLIRSTPLIALYERPRALRFTGRPGARTVTPDGAR